LDQPNVQPRWVIRGREVNTTGDGFVASFDGPARAIRCGQVIVDATRALGIELRMGLHTGECEVRGNDLGGLAVHIAARIGSLASPSEVLVSSTVKDLVVGSGIEFQDRGEQELRGVPGRWRLFRVEN
jgi:class 3 adenylate cyclase